MTDQLYMTLMAPSLSVESIESSERLLQQHGLEVIRRRWLSGNEAGRESAAGKMSDDTGSRIGEDVGIDGKCLRLTLGGNANIAELRKQALVLASELGIDVLVHAPDEWQGQRRLACFDMDSTLIQAEVIDELARAHGVYDEVASITARSMRGEFDFQQSFRLRMSKLKGLDESVLASIAESLPLMPGAERLLTELKARGYRTAIISGGFTYFAHYLQKRLGFDEVHANTLLIENGKVTGEVHEPILDAERKALIIGEIAEREGVDLGQCVAVGDGANDLRMLARAGLGVAFHAKPVVREQAQMAVSTLGLDALLFILDEQE